MRMLARHLFSAVAVSALTVPYSAHAQAQAYDLNIPAQDLGSALKALAGATGQQVVFREASVRGKVSRALKGRFTIDEAVAATISGSGLAASRSPRGVIVIIVANSAEIPNSTETADIVVTGTHIRGANPTSPVHTVTRKEIDDSGYVSVGDVVRSLPESFSGGQNPGVTGMAAGPNIENQNISGASTINLRGLGTGATLVLVNGHRLSADSFYQGSDISGIPLQAIDRIDIVTDGASAIYGSDAVAGVANFILKKNYRGLETSAQLGGATQGGGFQQTYSALGGASGSQGHILLNLEYTKQNEVSAGQREFVTGAPDEETLLPSTNRKSAFLSAGFNISDSVNLNFDGLYSRNSMNTTFRYSSVASALLTTTKTPLYSGTLSLNANLGRTWKFEVSGGASGSHNSANYTYPSTGTVSSYRFVNQIYYAEATLDGTAMSLPSGDVKAAIGAGYRYESFSDSDPTHGSNRVKYAYAELFIPVLPSSTDRFAIKEMEVSASVRMEDYNLFGRTTNPKIGVRYVPLKGLTVKGSWGTSFKSPSFNQLFQSSLVDLFQSSALGYSGAGTALLTEGGNPNLKPERSRSWSISAEYDPPFADDLKLSATWFDIHYRDRVVQPVASIAAAFSDPIYAPFLTWNPSAAYQASLISASTLGLYNDSGSSYDPASVIAVVNDVYTNATSQKIQGMDFSLQESFKWSNNQLDLFGNASTLLLKQRTIPSAPEAKLSGTIYWPPKFKARGGATWTHGGLSLTGIVNHVSGEMDTGITPNQHVASWTTVDANLAYRFPATSGATKGLKLALSASNLFDQDPPRVASAGQVFTGLYYDSTNASIMGRFVSFTLSKAW